MDLKFSFADRQPAAHDHDAAGAAMPPGSRALPFSTAPSATSSELILRVSRTAGSGADAPVVGEALSGDGVSYGRSEVRLRGSAGDLEALSATVRSATARVVAELGDPLSSSITRLELALDGTEASVAALLSLDPGAVPGELARASEAFQMRTGLAVGTPVVQAG